MKRLLSVEGYAELCDGPFGVIVALHPSRRSERLVEAHVVLAPHGWIVSARPPNPAPPKPRKKSKKPAPEARR